MDTRSFRRRLFTAIVLALVSVIIWRALALVPAATSHRRSTARRRSRCRPAASCCRPCRSELFLPSACGGGGTCAQCKCIVEEGGGAILPTEESHITARGREGWRLSCQVPVKQDMKIEVPEEVFGVKQWECRSRATTTSPRSSRNWCCGSRKARTSISAPAATSRSSARRTVLQGFRHRGGVPRRLGRSASGKLSPPSTSRSIRAYSMANYPEEKGMVKLNVRIATPPPGSEGIPPGIMSSYIFNLKPGDKVTIYGALRRVLRQGHGCGDGLHRRRCRHGADAQRTSSTSSSAQHQAQDLLLVRRALAARDVLRRRSSTSWRRRTTTSTGTSRCPTPQPEDNWDGLTGFIHNVLFEQYLKDHPAPEDCEYYMCGPPMMNAAVIQMLRISASSRKHHARRLRRLIGPCAGCRPRRCAAPPAAFVTLALCAPRRLRRRCEQEARPRAARRRPWAPPGPSSTSTASASPPRSCARRSTRSWQAINDALSTYLEDSEISRLNASPAGTYPVSAMFAEVLDTALRIGALTDSAYDVTVGPLVDLWGFGSAANRGAVPARAPSPRPRRGRCAAPALGSASAAADAPGGHAHRPVVDRQGLRRGSRLASWRVPGSTTPWSRSAASCAPWVSAPRAGPGASPSSRRDPAGDPASGPGGACGAAMRPWPPPATTATTSRSTAALFAPGRSAHGLSGGPRPRVRDRGRTDLHARRCLGHGADRPRPRGGAGAGRRADPGRVPGVPTTGTRLAVDYTPAFSAYLRAGRDPQPTRRGRGAGSRV
jgi:Na+-transporting NADH:ubiquinone oxidoreductase subunit F